MVKEQILRLLGLGQPRANPERNPILENIPREYHEIWTAETFGQLETLCGSLTQIEDTDRIPTSGYSAWFGRAIKAVCPTNFSDTEKIKKLCVEPALIFERAVNKGNDLFSQYKKQVIDKLSAHGEDITGLSPYTERHTLQSHLKVYLTSIGVPIELKELEAKQQIDQQIWLPHHQKLREIGEVLESARWYRDSFKKGVKTGTFLY